MQTPQIQTERLLIQELELDHLSDFCDYRSNPDIARYQGFDVMNLQEAETFIINNSQQTFGKPGEWKQLAIINKTTGNLIGDCALRIHKNDTTSAEIGISISHLNQKKGYAKEAVIALMRYIFEDLKIRRLVETVDAENTASIQLMRSIGFRQEALFIENIFFKGKWGSEIQFAMLAKEWEENKIDLY